MSIQRVPWSEARRVLLKIPTNIQSGAQGKEQEQEGNEEGVTEPFPWVEVVVRRCNTLFLLLRRCSLRLGVMAYSRRGTGWPLAS